MGRSSSLYLLFTFRDDPLSVKSCLIGRLFKLFDEIARFVAVLSHILNVLYLIFNIILDKNNGSYMLYFDVNHT